MKLLLMILFFSNFTLASTGRTVGNGGDVIVCKNSSYSNMVLDWFEGINLRGLHLNLGDTNLSISDKLEIAIHRLQRVSPFRAKKYLEHLQVFFEETKWLKDGVLVDIPDSDHIALPVDCELKQIANQAPPVLSSDKRYIIDFNLWQNLNNDQKAALLLHEVIYREAIENNQQNSVSSRFLNSLILSEEFEEIGQIEFNEILKKLGFELGEYNQFQIDLTKNYILKSGKKIFTPKFRIKYEIGKNIFWILPYQVELDEQNNLISAMLDSDSQYNDSQSHFNIEGQTYFQNSKLKTTSIIKGQFFSKFYKLLINIKGNTLWDEQFNLLQTDLVDSTEIQKNMYLNSTIFFNSDGSLLKGSLGQPFQFNLQGNLVAILPGTNVEFKDNKILKFRLASDGILKNCKGIKEKFRVFDFLEIGNDNCVRKVD